MTGEDLCYLSAGRALELFRSGELSPAALMRAIIERDDRVGALLNAFSDRYLDEALASASVSEARWMRGEERALEGVPVAVKDAQGIAGKRTTFGSPIYKYNIAANSDPMIERLANAGAIIHARTTTSEFCVSGICRSPLWGTTLNPWNRAFGPGGSSGGSAAALAGGLTTIATGTDMGGSIRVPASACGVVGFKPPRGRNPDGEPWNLDPRNHCGPLARTVRDIALVQNVVSGRHPLDRYSLHETLKLPVDPPGVEGLRVAFSIDLGYRAVDPDVRRTMLAALEVLRDLGCSIDEIELHWTDEIDQAFARWFEESQLGRDIARHAGEHPELLSEDMRRVAASMGGHAKGTSDPLLEIARIMRQTFDPVLESHDIFICPTMTIPAITAGHRMFAEDFKIDGRTVDPEFGYSTTHPFNILHDHPALSVPSGFASSGVPTGIQIVGRAFDDLTVYRAGIAYEQARGRWYETSKIRPRIVGEGA